MGQKSKNYTESYTEDYPELDGINNLVPKQQTIKLTEEEWSELNNGSKGTSTSQTAVEFLISKLGIPKITHNKLFEEALQMEKQQILDAWNDVYGHIRDAEEYYNETYGSKGSDEHIVDTTKMISSQTEISDEEIEKGAIEYYESPVGNIDREIGFRYAIKWYREQLRKLSATQEK